MANRIGEDGGPMKRIGPHNFLDNPTTFRDLFPVNALYKGFSLATTSIYPFVEDEQIFSKLMVCMAAGYGLGRIYSEGDANTATVDKGIIIAIGELIAPGLPPDMWLEMGLARTKLINTVRKIMMVPQAFMFFGVPTEGFIQRYLVKYTIDERFNIPIGSDDWININIDRKSAMKLLAAYGDAICLQSPLLPQRILVTMLIATLKKGSVTDPFTNKIITGMRTELGMDIQFSPELIRDVARIYGSYITSKIVRRIVNNWKTWIPEQALRLRLTVNQAVWEGLTGYNTIKKVTQLLPNFPWHELANIPVYMAEMEAVARAARLIDHDEYYGFNRDIGEAGIRHYKNLASVCAAIQHRALGDEQIQRAQCFTLNYAYNERVNRIINDFINQPNQQGDLNETVRTFLSLLKEEVRDTDSEQEDE